MNSSSLSSPLTCHHPSPKFSFPGKNPQIPPLSAINPFTPNHFQPIFAPLKNPWKPLKNPLKTP